MASVHVCGSAGFTQRLDGCWTRIPRPDVSEAFAATLQRYTERGGRVWPRLAEHCAEILSASSVAYGLFALETGVDEHRLAAAAQLNPGT